MPERSPTPFSLWLDEALSGWMVPVAALVAVGVVALLYFVGIASEDVTATVVVAAAGVTAGLYLVRPALDRANPAGGRWLAAAAALLTCVATVVPALPTVRPGDPIFSGEVAQVDDTVAVPRGVAGPVRLLVWGKLAPGGEPSITFTISGTREPIDGKLERTFGYTRIGRGGRARVAHDHTADFYPAEIPPGATALKLDRLRGQLVSPLHVAVYREPIPIAGGPWVLAAVALLAACLADARLGLRNNLAVASGMAVAFGLLVTYNATPAAAVGPAVGGIILGALVGSLAGWIAGAIVRRLVPPEKRRAPGKSGGAAAA